MQIDRDSWWWQKGRLAAVTVMALFATGLATSPLQQRAWAEMRSRQPALNLKDMGENFSQGVLLGVLGGFRSILADFLWIRGYTYWEKHDLPNMLAVMEIALTIDPSSTYFWNDASNKVGLDSPHWLIAAAPDGRNPATAARIFGEQTERAIKILDRGLTYHPGNYRLILDKGMLYQMQTKRAYYTGDRDSRKYLELAAEQYRLAAEAADSPFFAARIYARLLSDLGRDREAYDYLRKLYPTLANEQIEARKVDVWENLLELENKLNLPAAERLPQSAAPPGWTPELNTTKETNDPL